MNYNLDEFYVGKQKNDESFFSKYKYHMILYMVWALFVFFLLPANMGYVASIVLAMIWPLSIVFVLFFGSMNVGPAFGVILVGLFIYFIRYVFQMINKED
jgi:hypothetical protein